MAYVAHKIGDWVEYESLYADACARFGEQAVVTTFEELVHAGYLQCRVSARPGWLTERGLEALMRLRDAEREATT